MLAVRLFDPREVELPDVGALIMEDAETGEQLYVDTHDKGFRRRFREAADRREATLRDAFRRAGVDAVSLSTDEDLVARHRPHGDAPTEAPEVARCRSSGRRCSLLLLAIPLGAALYVVRERRRRRRRRAFGVVAASAGRVARAGRRPHAPPDPGGPHRSPA